MSKYPQVEAFFATHFGNDHGVVGPEARKKLQKATGVKYATVSRWVNGLMRPDSDSWSAIAGAAGVSAQAVKSAFNGSAPAGELTQLLNEFADLRRDVLGAVAQLRLEFEAFVAAGMTVALQAEERYDQLERRLGVDDDPQEPEAPESQSR